MNTATETGAAAPARVLTPEVTAGTDLSHVGVLTGAELAERAFRYGENAAEGGLVPGRQVAALEDHALVYGHVPAEQAILAAARLVWREDPHQVPDALGAYTAEPPGWAIFHRHALACTAGGDPSQCGCAPPDGPDSLWVTGAAAGTPAAVPVTPVRVPDASSAHAATAAQVDQWLSHPDIRRALENDGVAYATAYAVSLLSDSAGNQYAITRLAAHLLVRQMQTAGNPSNAATAGGPHPAAGQPSEVVYNLVVGGISSPGELQAHSGYSETVVRRALHALAEAGRVHKVRRGVWAPVHTQGVSAGG